MFVQMCRILFHYCNLQLQFRKVPFGTWTQIVCLLHHDTTWVVDPFDVKCCATREENYHVSGCKISVAG